MDDSAHPATEWHISAADFCKDTTAVNELAAFLQTETGQKLRRVLEGEHPLMKAARVRNLDVQSLFQEAMKEQQNPQGVLGFQRGYEAVRSLITQTLTRPLVTTQPASRKGGKNLKPHPATIPNS